MLVALGTLALVAAGLCLWAGWVRWMDQAERVEPPHTLHRGVLEISGPAAERGYGFPCAACARLITNGAAIKWRWATTGGFVLYHDRCI